MLLFNLKDNLVEDVDSLKRPNWKNWSERLPRFTLFASAVTLTMALGGTPNRTAPQEDFAGELSKSQSRELSANKGLPFPRVKQVKGINNELEAYAPYLRFVIVVGDRVDRRTSQKLRKKYIKLLKYDRRSAARFLRGLRYEMINRVQFMRVGRSKLSSQSRTMRRWVKRYIKIWLREVDELHFRAIALQASRSRTKN